VAKLASQYNVMLDNPSSKDDIKNLLAHVDIVPASLALAQAAMESAWGTSRFATEGNNYFGQWCYTKGCGLVPTQRNAGATHEVQAFVSPANSVAAYMRNINRHNSYRTLRTLRAKARTSQQPIYGCTLANGLGNYSERGQAYVDEIKQMISINGLSESIDAPC
jgi:Bax protein